SSSMEDLQTATQSSLFELVRTGVAGHMRAGDTYGLWTFNKTTQTGRFDMHVWDPRKTTQQAAVAAAVLNGLNYEKSANFKPLMETLGSVIHSVSNLNVLVISDGAAEMQGTPYDKQINAACRQQRSARRRAKQPFIISLVVRDGW